MDRARDTADCPLCAGTSWRHVLTLGHRCIVRCRGCGHRYAARFDPEVLRAEYRDAYCRDPADPRMAAWAAEHVPVWDAIVRQIQALCPGLRSLLDVGAGTGGFLARVRARDAAVELSAVEPSAAARAFLAARVEGVDFPVHDAAGLHAVERSYDAVTFLQTLEHLEDPVGVCRDAVARLRPGGLLFVTVPNRRSLAVRLRGRRASCWADNTHLQFFDRAHLEAALQRAGLTRIRRVVGFGGGQYRGPVARGAQYVLRRLGWGSELRLAGWR